MQGIGERECALVRNLVTGVSSLSFGVMMSSFIRPKMSEIMVAHVNKRYLVSKKVMLSFLSQYYFIKILFYSRCKSIIRTCRVVQGNIAILDHQMMSNLVGCTL
ncbi:hypothetical protein QG37_01504 [Candidozyma auris]|nr:hypothetical protein QG37_01504 [[Candida] auris]